MESNTELSPFVPLKLLDVEPAPPLPTITVYELLGVTERVPSKKPPPPPPPPNLPPPPPPATTR